MLTVVNFSHPTRAELLAPVLGCEPDEVNLIRIPVQVEDWNKLSAYAAFLVQKAVEEAGGALNIDCIIPPGHGTVSAAVTAQFAREHYIPNIVVVARIGDVLPPRFEPVALIRGGRIC